MNKVILIGRITKDIELKKTQSGKSFCNFSIACDRRFKNADGSRQTDFISCVAWNQTAEFLSKYFGKGSRVAVVGSIQTRTADGSDGKKNYYTEVIVEEAEFVESQKSSQQTQTENASTESAEGLPFEL